MSILDETKFNIDWKVHQKVESLAIQLLSKGLNPEEVREKIIHSKEYNEWISVERCFGTEYQKLFYYTDLLGSIAFERYENQLKQLARMEMDIEEVRSELVWGIEYDKLFGQIGLKIHPGELGRQIGRFSKLLNLKEPIGLLPFLSLLTGNASSLIGVEEDTLDALKKRINDVDLFIENFKISYKQET